MPKNDQIWPEIGIFVHFGPGLACSFGALWVGLLVFVARGLYLARHLFTFLLPIFRLHISDATFKRLINQIVVFVFQYTLIVLADSLNYLFEDFLLQNKLDLPLTIYLLTIIGCDSQVDLFSLRYIQSNKTVKRFNHHNKEHFQFLWLVCVRNMVWIYLTYLSST